MEGDGGMRRKNIMAADRLDVRIRGPRARGLLSASVRAGIHLSRVHCTGDGYQARISGHEWARFQGLARQGGWTPELVDRAGPGCRLEGIARRPGLIAGLVLFLVLQLVLTRYVWSIDFSALEPEEAQAFRLALAEQGIWEGARLSEAQLRTAQQALTRQLDTQGWISLNFLDGRLVLEHTRSEIQTVQQPAEPGALYAAAGGQVVAVELEGGFTAVQPGQYVAAGQLLVNGQKADRSGDPVVQGAAGRVVARVEKTYTARWRLRQTVRMLTGAHSQQTEWYLLGQTLAAGTQEPAADDLQTVDWQPLRLGQIALPACARRTETWEKAERELVYSEKAAAALAHRSCRQQLLAEFPDARLEEEDCHTQSDGEAVRCTVRYVFLADITTPGPLAPLPEGRGDGQT